MSNPRQKLSGAEYRKRAKEKSLRQKENATTMTNWLQKSSKPEEQEFVEQEPDERNNSEDDSAVQITEVVSRESNTNSSIQISHSHSECDASMPHTSKETYQIEDTQNTSEDTSETSNQSNFDSSDPATWPTTNLMSDNTRSFLCSETSKQSISYPHCVDFPSTQRNGRCLTPLTWEKTLGTGGKTKRKWLVHSKKENALFCAPCKLFDNTTNPSNVSTLVTNGFINWRKNSEKLSLHESSIHHTRAMIKWITLASSMKNKSGIDKELEKSVQTEKEKWRVILRIICDIILYLATNCLSFRGSTENTSSLLDNTPSPTNGNFLNLVALVAKHNTILKDKLELLRKGQTMYLSKTIQNEVIAIMSHNVRQKILEEIKTAKYYSIMFDCTPDSSHCEQMSQVIRYVKVCENGECKIVERFVDFIEVHEKTGEYMANVILAKLENDGLRISDCRGQSYDNGSNMSGVNKGVQARILGENKYAVYVPCIAHSLNLVGVHASCSCPEAERLFGVVQRIYNFFVASTVRWEMMKEHTKSNLKGSSQTRWSAKAEAVSALKNNLKEVVKVLTDLKDGDFSPETKSEAHSLLRAILDFEIILYLVMWNEVLKEINRVNKEIQKIDIILTRSINLIEGLQNTMKRLRNTGFDDWFTEAALIAESVSVDPNLPEKRVPKRKRMPGELADDELRTLSAKERIIKSINTILDRIINEIENRFQSAKALNADFAFFHYDSLMKMDSSNLKKIAINLANKYERDLNSTELVTELEVFREQGALLQLNFSELQPKTILEIILKNDFQDAFPNMCVALKIYCTLPTTSASCERSFSKLKLIKNYLRSTMSQERLTGLALLSIENEMANSLNYNNIIDDFAEKKARKISL